VAPLALLLTTSRLESSLLYPGPLLLESSALSSFNGDTLYVGGQFTVQGSNLNGFAIYDLAGGQWAHDGLQPLVTSTGTVSVRSLSLSEARSDTLIVAGSFENAGSFPCRAICALNVNSKQWTTLGNGLGGGQVSTLVLAGVRSNCYEASLCY
jgi:hypothetical protein